MNEPLRMGMVGGGRDAFIGAVHRTAACLDNGVRFVAGCLSSSPDKALASGADLGLDPRRNYRTWEDMLQGELALPPGQRIDFISIVTPNHVHYPVARAFAAAGIDVVCDKPLCHTSEQARDLAHTANKSGVVFAVTYNYSGYPMVKQARDMARQGELGDIRKVIVEYNQGWLAGKLESTGQKQADWRTDPSRSGAGGAIGDIGSHAEQLVAYVTGLEIDAICADLTTFVPGRRLDDDANLLIRYAPRGGVQAKGILTASQIEIGHENDLRLRVYGTKASLIWHQEHPNQLSFRPDGEPERIYSRGNGYLGAAARKNTRIPAGHPEAFLEAFANVYNAAGAAIRARRTGAALADADFPTVIDGARGVHFIEKTIESSRSDRKWTDARWTNL
ncbi:MAG: Gfo/Idh/MocA family oxidoreductase [Phycisphaerales bacterium]|nr:Gfo/Idh/MocA family oxidoreductase [Phycisphaerales bacterium]